MDDVPGIGAQPEQEVDEASLVAGLRAGDEDAFELLVRTYGGRLLAVARRIMRDESEAQDALQDGFLSAFRSIDSFKGDARLPTWLHRIVVNASLMRLRSRKRRREASIEDLLPRYDAAGHHITPPKDWGASSQALLEREETRQMVRGKIDELPDDYRAVLLLRDIEGLDTAETAAVLEITSGAVKTRLHRARLALRTLLEQELAP